MIFQPNTVPEPQPKNSTSKDLSASLRAPTKAPTGRESVPSLVNRYRQNETGQESGDKELRKGPRLAQKDQFAKALMEHTQVPVLNRLGKRISECCQEFFVDYASNPESDTGFEFRSQSNHCRSRYCCVCGSVLQGKRARRVRQVVKKSKLTPSFLTFTLPAKVPLVKVSQAISDLQQGLKRVLRHSGLSSIQGSFSSIEPKRTKDGTYHVHVHLLAGLKPNEKWKRLSKTVFYQEQFKSFCQRRSFDSVEIAERELLDFRLWKTGFIPQWYLSAIAVQAGLGMRADIRSFKGKDYMEVCKYIHKFSSIPENEIVGYVEQTRGKLLWSGRGIWKGVNPDLIEDDRGLIWHHLGNSQEILNLYNRKGDLIALQALKFLMDLGIYTLHNCPNGPPLN